ncbi:hypothetical protein [Sphingobacterium sp.]|uniref:hypothetical protein n=1 Tax=Sphingobacterium sp. TaxID=341027 RepID=UPI0028AEB812|nr:hypothetical protein [Sphingobacterium sp.]
MSLKSKIISKLKVKAKSLKINLSNVRINGLADKLDSIVDNEDDIDGEIDKLDSILSFKELATLDDAKRNADRLAAEQEDEDVEEEDEPETQPNQQTDKKKTKSEEINKDEMPPWFKAHVENQNKIIEGLTTQLTNFQKQDTAKSRRELLEGKIKDAPEKFKSRTLRDFDRLKIESDEEFNEYLADIEQDVADEIQFAADSGLGIDSPTGGIGGQKLRDDEVSPAMKQLVEQRKAEAVAKANA